MKQQEIRYYTGYDVNCWLEEKNQKGWYIKEIFRFKQFIDTKRYDCIFLMEREVKIDESNNDQ